ncbi:membrane-bound lytic murein transglycosylase [Candidatus Scalindua japonica]|uniref:Membrane-bound lytic murein transglycosylase n=1 Tax=Candidatus Scalindua japonica TaxID=1284222 RepID=A0A286U3Z4_9BACT|nr:3D domain-containing protein [Candidatus Scalindua japonica]GAX62859.1 membrane-bound lytic murein transglycosylase [Candidatus Scalindua japonica]
MIQKNNTFNCLLGVALLVVFFLTGCATTTVQETSLSSTEALKTASSPSKRISGTGLTEITDTNKIPDFKDDYGKIELLYAVDNSRLYFEKVKSYPGTFKSIGFTPEKQVETLKLFRDGYVSSKSPQELTEFIAKNFRIFQATGKEHGGEVHFKGYGFPISDKNVTNRTSLAYDWNTAVYFGSLGLHVTPMRSIATDDKVLPPGGLAFVVIEGSTNLNQDKRQSGKSFFVLANDSRSTAKTADRADIFFGIGKNAIQKAENFNTTGKLYYLLKR